MVPIFRQETRYAILAIKEWCSLWACSTLSSAIDERSLLRTFFALSSYGVVELTGGTRLAWFRIVVPVLWQITREALRPTVKRFICWTSTFLSFWIINIIPITVLFVAFTGSTFLIKNSVRRAGLTKECSFGKNRSLRWAFCTLPYVGIINMVLRAGLTWFRIVIPVFWQIAWNTIISSVEWFIIRTSTFLGLWIIHEVPITVLFVAFTGSTFLIKNSVRRAGLTKECSFRKNRSLSRALCTFPYVGIINMVFRAGLAWFRIVVPVFWQITREALGPTVKRLIFWASAFLSLWVINIIPITVLFITFAGPTFFIENSILRASFTGKSSFR